MLTPSVAVIIVPDHDTPALDALVCQALAGAGYRPRLEPLPRHYQAAGHEWLGFAITSVAGPVGSLGVLLPEALDSVFDTACSLSRRFGPRPIVGWRRFMGLAPVWKLFTDGVPRYRDGDDADLEVDFPVPTHPPIDTPRPESSGLPADAASVPRALGDALRPYREALGAGALDRAFLHKSSQLAP